MITILFDQATERGTFENIKKFNDQNELQAFITKTNLKQDEYTIIDNGR